MDYADILSSRQPSHQVSQAKGFFFFFFTWEDPKEHQQIAYAEKVHVSWATITPGSCTLDEDAVLYIYWLHTFNLADMVVFLVQEGSRRKYP